MPNFRTVKRRVDAIDAKEHLRKRAGAKAAALARFLRVTEHQIKALEGGLRPADRRSKKLSVLADRVFTLSALTKMSQGKRVSSWVCLD
jgi:hypothetical protein